MARIRTIKPEFPHSESMGNVTRDARLCFILLWTVADDSGRLRGNSRMLASLLYPYDDDAKKLIDGWLSQLEREQCITRYQVEGASYIQIEKWREHQKIDKPSASKLPAPDEASRSLANPREGSSEEGTKDQGMDQGSKDDGNAPKGAKKIPNCPYDQIAAIYNTTLPELPSIASMPEGRKEAIRKMWVRILTEKRLDGTMRATDPNDALEWFKAYFSRVRESDFLMGRDRKDGRYKDWKCDIDYLMTDRAFIKITEKT